MTQPWSEAHTKTLLALRAKGLSFGAMAQQLGVSRSAIAGKMTRLGLSAARTPGRPRREKPTRLEKPKRELLVRLWPRASEEPAISVPVPDLAIPFKQRRTLLELKEHHCRWPIGDVGDPDFFFCGAPHVPGSSYCAHHTRRSMR